MQEDGIDPKGQPTSNTAGTQAERSAPGFGAAPANESASSQTSERKKQVNRENSKHSTGPKTDEGKSRSRMNAYKHGFNASEVVIRQGDGKEDPEEFEILLKGVRRALEPRDVMQECLVRTIAEMEWRLRRAGRAEVGEIRRQTDSYYARLRANAYDDDLPAKLFWSVGLNKDGIRDTALRFQSMLSVLGMVREDLEQHGHVSEPVQQALDSTYGKAHHLADLCHRFSQALLSHKRDQWKQGNDGEGPLDDSLELHKNTLFRLIDISIENLKESLTNIEQAEDREQQANLLACNLPSREFVDKLIRYETALVNRRDRAVKLLLRLQGK